MPRIRRHQTVELDTGGWIDLKGCEVWWGYRGPFSSRLKHLWFPGGLFFARKGSLPLLLRTPQDRLIVKELGYGEPNQAQAAFRITPTYIAWREVSTMNAFLWLQQHSRRHARRLFPDLAAQQRRHTLSGER